MMVFTSIYGVVDGYFVSNFVGKTPFAAVNFIYPFIMILGSFGFMYGSGGSALISKTMGEGDLPKANRFFSMLTFSAFLTGIVFAVIGLIFIKPFAALLGAEGDMLTDCVAYGKVLLYSMPLYMLQMAFQSFFVTAEKPQMGLYITIAAGVTNMVLDALFIAVFNWGIVGAAAATAISQAVGGGIPVIYFLTKNSSPLRLSKPTFDKTAFFKTCTNGSSELLSNASMSLVGLLYNVQLMKYAGENGVAAYGVMMYVSLIFVAIFIGYSIGTAPVIGYHYGADNSTELKSLLKKSLTVMISFSVVMLLLGELLAYPLGYLFVGYDKEVLNLTVSGFRIFSLQFLFSGLAIFGSGFFTALNNGLISAIISFLRTLVFQIASIIVLPMIFKVDGIWLSVVVAEFMAATLSVIFIIKYKNKYNY